MIIETQLVLTDQQMRVLRAQSKVDPTTAQEIVRVVQSAVRRHAFKTCVWVDDHFVDSEGETVVSKMLVKLDD